MKDRPFLPTEKPSLFIVSYEPNNTAHISAGLHAIKVHYDGGYGALSLHPKGNATITNYDSMKVSIYAPSDSVGKVTVYFNGSSGVSLKLQEGQYKQFFGNEPHQTAVFAVR